YWNTHYAQKLKDSSYDDILRKDLIWLLAAKIVVQSKPESSKHDSTRGYCISTEAADLIRTFGSPGWEEVASRFCNEYGKLSENWEKRRCVQAAATSDLLDFQPQYSYGEHGYLLRAVIERFLPRFLKQYKVIFFEDNVCKYGPAEVLKGYGLERVGDSMA